MGKRSVDELHSRMHSDDMLNTSKTDNQSMADRIQYRLEPKITDNFTEILSELHQSSADESGQEPSDQTSHRTTADGWTYLVIFFHSIKLVRILRLVFFEYFYSQTEKYINFLKK